MYNANLDIEKTNLLYLAAHGSFPIDIALGFYFGRYTREQVMKYIQSNVEAKLDG